MMDTTVKIAGRTFDHCVMNAAGVMCMTSEELMQVAQSGATTFVTKTATLESRDGNLQPRYFDFATNSINSMGLPNHGISYYLDFLSSESKELQAKRFLSIAPLHPKELPVLLQCISESNFLGLVELNLSCPNVSGKPQIGYDFEQTERLLYTTFSQYHSPIGVKLPPYFDIAHFDQMAEILNRYPLTFINSINSLGNGIVLNGNSMAIHPKNGFGGIGGSIIKPTALANVHAFYQRLNPDIKIIGTGGVTCGRDVYEHILCGAHLVQVGTALHQEGVSVFQRLRRELQDEMTRNNVHSFDMFRGKVNYI
ncbi:dihydroorotate oxidase [Aerococcaceae bacterium zg-ZUI334]|uniref:dihydroorotate oxidase n=1 Tax=Aerococcaceae bacterium zg-252 TaxID=2796928 RepID=UPI001B95C010|nr:dihydroorotate oxidase [Aerococcaceae bacterium zg-ZUI334]